VNYELPKYTGNIRPTALAARGRAGASGHRPFLLRYGREGIFEETFTNSLPETIPVVEDHPYHSVSGTNRSFEGQRQK